MLAHLRAVPWRLDQRAFKAWRQGLTGAHACAREGGLRLCGVGRCCSCFRLERPPCKR